jgi:uncharacterized SAM-binding protein YcdF (DUF218 family)
VIVLRQRAIAIGLPATAVQSTSQVRNTADEARVVAAMLPARSTVMLVISAFHMPRARRLFERQGLTVLPFAVDFQASGVWAGHPLREAIGRTVYRAW